MVQLIPADVKRVREQLGLTVELLAGKAKIPLDTLEKFETGRIYLDKRCMHRLAAVLNLSPTIVKARFRTVTDDNASSAVDVQGFVEDITEAPLEVEEKESVGEIDTIEMRFTGEEPKAPPVEAAPEPVAEESVAEDP